MEDTDEINPSPEVDSIWDAALSASASSTDPPTLQMLRKSSALSNNKKLCQESDRPGPVTHGTIIDKPLDASVRRSCQRPCTPS